MPTRLATVSTGSTPSTGGTSLTFSHTVDSGTDVLLVSVCLGGSTPVVSGVTFDGVALTQKADASAGDGQKRVDWWYLLSPTVTTANVVVSFNFARGGAVAVNYDDVDVAGTPFGTGAAASAVSGTTPTVDVSSASGEVVISAAGSQNGDTVTATVGASQSEIANFITAAGAGLLSSRMVCSDEAGAASVTMNYTLSSSQGWATGSFALKPAPSAGGGSGAAERPRGSFMTQFYKNEQTAARRRLPLWLVQSDGTTPAQFEASAPFISINGGSYYTSAATLSSVSTGVGEYYAQLAPSDLSVLGRGRLIYSSATVGKADADFLIVDTDPYNSGLVSQNTLLTGGTTSSITLASGETTTNDVFNGAFVLLTYPSGFKIGNIISDYTGSTKEAALQNVLPITAASGMTYEIYPGTETLQIGAVWDELRSDHAVANSFGEYVPSQLTGTSAATIQGVQSVQTVQALASTVSVVLQPTTHSGATIPAVQSVQTVNALASDVSVFLKPSVHTGATVPTVTVTGGVTSAVSILAGSYSAVTVQAGSLAPSAVTTVVQSVLSGELGNGRTVREALYLLRNKVQTDPASSVATVFATDDATSAWTLSISTSAFAITGFDPAGP